MIGEPLRPIIRVTDPIARPSSGAGEAVFQPVSKVRYPQLRLAAGLTALSLSIVAMAGKRHRDRQTGEESSGWPSRWKGSSEETRLLHGKVPNENAFYTGPSKPNPTEDNKRANAAPGMVEVRHHTCGGKGCEGCSNTGTIWRKG